MRYTIGLIKRKSKNMSASMVCEIIQRRYKPVTHHFVKLPLRRIFMPFNPVGIRYLSDHFGANASIP